jgi:hypothetical protein
MRLVREYCWLSLRGQDQSYECCGVMALGKTTKHIILLTIKVNTHQIKPLRSSEPSGYLRQFIP